MTKESRLISAALQGKATLAVKNARVVNVFTGEIIPADVALYHDTIIGVGEYGGETQVDAQGAYLCPGFIDAHVHIESSMVIPENFARVVLPHGTTAIIADPHEIANVAGAAGIRAMYRLTEGLPLRVFLMMPSCVPATPFENSGADLSAGDMEPFLQKSRILGLGEVMDYVSAINGQKEMLDKLLLFKDRPIDGHAPLLSGRQLNAYLVAGPSTDHECSSYEEVLEKLRRGMRILIRAGSAANGIEELLCKIVENRLPTDNMMFCTDDKHLADIRSEGHINSIAALAVRCGMEPVQAVRMASYNTARAYGLRRIGAIAPGYKGDMALVEDLQDFKVLRTFTRFGAPYDPDFVTDKPPLPPALCHGLRTGPLNEQDLQLKAAASMPVIGLTEGQLFTKRLERAVRRDNNGCFIPDGKLNKLAVVERHRGSGNIGLGIVEGLHIRGGALASTVAHDSHNLVAAGDNDRDILAAIESLKECGGGYSVVGAGKVLARLPLPIAGLMTDVPVEEALAKQREALDAAAAIGCGGRSDPLIALSFLALPVIPEIRLTDKGLFDVTMKKFI